MICTNRFDSCSFLQLDSQFLAFTMFLQVSCKNIWNIFTYCGRVRVLVVQELLALLLACALFKAVLFSKSEYMFVHLCTLTLLKCPSYDSKLPRSTSRIWKSENRSTPRDAHNLSSAIVRKFLQSVPDLSHILSHWKIEDKKL